MHSEDLMTEPTKNLLITGSHPDVLIDIAAVPRVCTYDLLAVGLDAVDKYPWPIKYVATYHPAEIPKIRERRERLIGLVDFAIISHEQRDHVEIYIADWWKPSGSSALLGVQAALGLGYQKIILCGCPLTGKNLSGGGYETFRQGWEAHAGDLKDSVRSMSGWTADFLGHPTDEWLLSGGKR